MTTLSNLNDITIIGNLISTKIALMKRIFCTRMNFTLLAIDNSFQEFNARFIASSDIVLVHVLRYALLSLNLLILLLGIQYNVKYYFNIIKYVFIGINVYFSHQMIFYRIT